MTNDTARSADRTNPPSAEYVHELHARYVDALRKAAVPGLRAAKRRALADVADAAEELLLQVEDDGYSLNRYGVVDGAGNLKTYVVRP